MDSAALLIIFAAFDALLIAEGLYALHHHHRG